MQPMGMAGTVLINSGVHDILDGKNRTVAAAKTAAGVAALAFDLWNDPVTPIAVRLNDFAAITGISAGVSIAIDHLKGSTTVNKVKVALFAAALYIDRTNSGFDPVGKALKWLTTPL